MQDLSSLWLALCVSIAVIWFPGGFVTTALGELQRMPEDASQALNQFSLVVE